jgi:predicted GNAT family acetyltransferase
MSEEPRVAVDVVDLPDRSRYQATVDGEPAGFTYYEREGTDRIVFVHTEVDPAYEGKGVGSAIARAALDDVRRQGLVAVPVCPFFATFIRRHPEYADLTRPR